MLLLSVVLTLLPLLTRAVFTISPPGPTIKQCSQVDLIFTEQPPVHIWVAPNRDIAPGDPVLQDLGIIGTSVFSWTANLTIGQVISFTYVRIAEQTLLLSSPEAYTIVAGDTAACLQTNSPTTTTTSSTSTPITTSTAITTLTATVANPPVSTTPKTSVSSTVASPSETETTTARSTSTTSSNPPAPNTHLPPQSTDEDTQPTAAPATNTDGTSSASSTPSVGVIAGAAAGGAVLLVALVVGAVFCVRRKRRMDEVDEMLVQPYEPHRTFRDSPRTPGSGFSPQMGYANVPQTGSTPSFSPGVQHSFAPNRYGHASLNYSAGSSVSGGGDPPSAPGSYYDHPTPSFTGYAGVNLPPTKAGYANGRASVSGPWRPQESEPPATPYYPPASSDVVNYADPFVSSSDAGSAAHTHSDERGAAMPHIQTREVDAGLVLMNAQSNIGSTLPPAYEDLPARQQPPIPGHPTRPSEGAVSAATMSPVATSPGVNLDEYEGLAYLQTTPSPRSEKFPR